MNWLFCEAKVNVEQMKRMKEWAMYEKACVENQRSDAHCEVLIPHGHSGGVLSVDWDQHGYNEYILSAIF